MKLKIAVPTRGLIHYKTAWALLRLQKKFNVDCAIGKNTESVAYNRNLLVKSFLESDNTHLLFIDDDVVPHSTVDLEELVSLDKDILALPCPVNIFHTYGSNYLWNVFPEKDELAKVQGFGVKKVFAAGTGFMLIHRRVLEKITNPFTFKRKEDDCVINGEDYLFCEKARKEGFEIWVDWGYPCSHYKDTDILEFL